MKTKITKDIVVVSVRRRLPAAEKDLLENNGITIASFHQLREQLLRSSEHVLRAGVADLFQRGVSRIHYIFGALPEEKRIIIHLNPL